MPWNRTYRPHTLADLHLTSVRENLQTLLKNKKIPHVFLFAGPKGTGKTSSSRIIGAILNEPKNKEIVEELFFGKKASKKSFVPPDPSNPFIEKILTGSSYTVQEMDAASNRGIDNIRELKERVALPPQEGLVTVYILDEAHMLTTEAFNALLKVLEEPPEHVVFILATTELHKVPDTIKSRSHLVAFKKASKEELTQALERIIGKEKLKAEPEAVQLIAAHADGSFRDAIKLLELLSEEGSLTLSAVTTALSLTDSGSITAFVSALIQKNAAEVVLLFQKLRDQGNNEKYFHTTLLEYLHATLLANYGIGTAPLEITEAATLFLLKEFADSQLSTQSVIPFLHLEIKTLEIIARATQKSNTSPKVRSKAESIAPAPTITLPLPMSTQNSPTKKEIQKLQRIETEIVSSPARITVNSDAPQGDGQVLLEKWKTFVDAVAADNSTFGALLRSAQPISAVDNEITIGVYYKFHQEQLSDTKFLIRVQDYVEKICGGYISFTFTLVDTPATADLTSPSNEAKDLAQLASESLM